MSAAILDRARAFEMIAAHLSEDRRAEIAEAIADKLLSEVGGGKPKPAADRPVQAPDPAPVDLSEHTQVASFLADHGFERKALVDATLELSKWLVTHPNFTREAGMQIWVAQQKELAS